jgi:ATP-dependent RNA helicase DeaD
MGKTNIQNKPNHEVDAELKTKIKTVFHHLTKDELIENCWLIVAKQKNEPVEKPVKDKKMK